MDVKLKAHRSTPQRRPRWKFSQSLRSLSRSWSCLQLDSSCYCQQSWTQPGKWWSLYCWAWPVCRSSLIVVHSLVVLIFYPVIMCSHVFRYHSALHHLWSVFWGVSRAGVVVDIQPLHQHAAFQFSVCDDGYLQCRTSASSVSVSAANVAAACTTRWHLCQV